MLGEFTPIEVAAGCPAVLLVDETIITNRVTDRIEAMNSSELDIEAFVGFAESNGDLLPMVAPGAAFTSRRKLTKREGADDRTVRPTALSFADTAGEYQIGEASFVLGGVLGTVIKSNLAPYTDSKSTFDYVVFQAFPPTHPEQTRGGLFGVERDGMVAPLAATHEGKRYAIDIKGCGNALGNMMPARDKFFKPIVAGGLPLQDAYGELHNMQRARAAGLTPMVPVAAAKIMLDQVLTEHIGDLGVVIRLTPSSVRLSYADMPGSVIPENRAEAMVIVDKLLDNFIGKFFLPKEAPVFISPASHLENYLVTEGVTITETDFEDFRDFGSRDFPFVHTQTADFVDTRTVLRHYFTNFSRVEAFDHDEDYRVVAASTQRKLKNLGVEVELTECESIEDIAEKLWYQWLLEKDYALRMDTGYRPEQMVKFFVTNSSKLSEMSGRLTPEEEMKPFHELGKLVQEGGSNAKLLDGVLKKSLLIRHVYGTDELTNRDRYPVLVAAYEQMYGGFEDLVESIGAENIPDAAYKVREVAFMQYEFAARVAGGMKFFEEWVISEATYTRALAAKGVAGLETLIDVLEHLESTLKYLMDDSDANNLSYFAANYQDRYVGMLDQMYDATYQPG